MVEKIMNTMNYQNFRQYLFQQSEEEGNTLPDKPVEKAIIKSINGPIIKAKGFIHAAIGDMVEIGKSFGLIGEIIKIQSEYAIIQCYEETVGLCINDEIYNLGYPLCMELAPGILNTIYDGIQRPLSQIAEIAGDFISRGVKVPSIDRKKQWEFVPEVHVGDHVSSGDYIGYVLEGAIKHNIMVPIGLSGSIRSITPQNKVKITDPIYNIFDSHENRNYAIPLLQRWPIRIPRPFLKRNLSSLPLFTGTRVIDLLFPVAQGGTVAVPGGFGTGKTVVQQSLAKFADADIIVYIGCGERGNEMAELLEQFPKLEDPRYHRPLMERTIMIGNTSNMPVSAREASIFAGITMAEYWRDQGKNVLLLADSTSRWAEALRELSARLEEMPTEGGYPAYLSTRLGNFYERAGYVDCLGSPNRTGSVTIVGAVSPQGGDFSEPVTKSTKRFIKAFWGLDAKLAYARHYPSINWNDSYSLYSDFDQFWEEKVEEGWAESRQEVNFLLAKANVLENITQLIGAENLPPDQQLILFAADLIKNAFLIQSAFDPIDRYSAPIKTLKMIKIILKFYNETLFLVKKGIPMFRIKELGCVYDIKRMRLDIPSDQPEKFNPIISKIASDLMLLQRQYKELF
jgi:V/A-type H+-transporting ATPase subunit A